MRETNMEKLMTFAMNKKSMFCAFDASKSLDKDVTQIYPLLASGLKNGGLLNGPLGCNCTGSNHMTYIYNDKPGKFADDIQKPKSYTEKIRDLAKISQTGFCAHQASEAGGCSISSASAIIIGLMGDRLVNQCSEKGKCNASDRKHTFYYAQSRLTKEPIVVEEKKPVVVPQVVSMKVKLLKIRSELDNHIMEVDDTCLRERLMVARDEIERVAWHANKDEIYEQKQRNKIGAL